MRPTKTPGNPFINTQDSLLLIIDMQERLIPAMAEKEVVVENAIRLARFSRLIGIPVLLTEQQKLGATLPQIREALGDIQAIPKIDFNCFGSETFAEEINSLKRKNVIIAGVEAHVCVTQTALCAASSYRVQVVSDAISSRSLHNRDVALRRMEQNGITITSTEMVIFELLQKAGTDLFKEVLKLVK